jgi:AbrB family looped-hinge helix DNA binding protein
LIAPRRRATVNGGSARVAAWRLETHSHLHPGARPKLFAYQVSDMVDFDPRHHHGSILVAAATLTEKGQIVIPAEIRARYGLTAGTQLEFVDDNGVIRLKIRRQVRPSDPAAGFGLVKIKPAPTGTQRRLSEFDAAESMRNSRKKK